MHTVERNKNLDKHLMIDNNQGQTIWQFQRLSVLSITDKQP